MTLRRRILLYYSLTLSFSLVIVAYWSWYELTEQHNEVRQGYTHEFLENHPPLEEAFEIIFYGGLPAILLGVLIGGFLMRRAFQPIENLIEALENTDIYNLSAPVPRNGNGDELDRMAAVFNRMKERLDRSFAQVRVFTLNASHELKTPLTIMHGTLEQAITRVDATEREREGAASLLEEVQRLSTIVGQLSFLARADAGLVSFSEEAVAIHDLIKDLAEELVILSTGKNISVSVSRCEPVVVFGDKMRLRQLLLNLGDNAVKYNKDGGEIELALQERDGVAIVTIANTGTSLSPELSSRVFEPFFRGDFAHNSVIEGSGLGLSIARSIVEAHKGHLDYDTLADGRTCVTLSLPGAVQP